MANVRIKDITTTASAPAADDYLAIDGATSGTRKVLAKDLQTETDTTLTVAGKAADAKATGDELDSIKECIETGDIPITKELNWINAFIDISGVIVSSGASKVCVVKMYEGETVNIGTRNTSITIIGSTENETVAVGDRVTVIQRTSNIDQFEEYSYTATGTINIVLCVGWSEYSLSFYKKNDILKTVETLNETAEKMLAPELINGSALNHGNVNSITNKTVIGINEEWTGIIAELEINLPLDAYIIWVVNGFTKDAVGLDSAVANSLGYLKLNKEARQPSNYTAINLMPIINGLGGFSVSPFVWQAGGSERIPLRIDNYQYKIKIHTSKAPRDYYRSGFDDFKNAVLNAQHIAGGSIAPLTLLHFSDLHSDKEALTRIIKDAKASGLSIDDYICTGDIVAGTYEQIASWWPNYILTCIGNHDTASYTSGSGYDWTALSMADRDAYYIAPFESNWGITHTSGTSYYYKDYQSAHVRLIVMDAMLYTDNGAEATAQNTWLENLLADAITNNLHVLIAIHSPHGGATAKVCSFSKYNEGVMPTNADCNTPQTVIDIVEAKKNNGLKFIGYIVGHTHKDDIWDCENNGSQLMYCITCANVLQTAQWSNADMQRSAAQDAFNMVVIDTAHTLVKLIRGGGANIDNVMRPRKGITFNYSTGEIVGEIL